jgi:nucleotide-binding universal stress UspA family protein
VTSADLVVVGQNGRRGSRLWSSGVLATGIARAVASPTLTAANDGAVGPGVTASFDNILCAIDFSAASFHALNEALTLAQQSGGRLTLLHVVEGGVPDQAAARVERELRALVPPDALNWCEVETKVASGTPHDAILATASARAADLVVVGRPQRTSRDGIVMASTLSGVLRSARCPVLAVPGPSDGADVASKETGTVRHEEEAMAAL